MGVNINFGYWAVVWAGGLLQRSYRHQNVIQIATSSINQIISSTYGRLVLIMLNINDLNKRVPLFPFISFNFMDTIEG